MAAASLKRCMPGARPPPGPSRREQGAGSASCKSRGRTGGKPEPLSFLGAGHRGRRLFYVRFQPGQPGGPAAPLAGCSLADALVAPVPPVVSVPEADAFGYDLGAVQTDDFAAA